MAMIEPRKQLLTLHWSNGCWGDKRRRCHGEGLKHEQSHLRINARCCIVKGWWVLVGDRPQQGSSLNCFG
ncbi:hypothetical protein QQP08_005107, partial [Theobroma cacao]